MDAKFKLLKIKPADTLFLGGGKSFNKGENSWHQSRLFPYPSVFYGAICSAMLEKNPVRLKAYIQNQDACSNPRKYLQIGSVYLYEKKNNLDKNLYIPAPRDLFINELKRVSFGKFKKVSSGDLDSSLSDVTHLFQSPKADVERVDGMFIDWNSFLNMYYRTWENIHLIGNDDIATPTYKVGIARDEKKLVAKDEHLYRLDLLDFNKGKWSYLVEYSICDSWWTSEHKELGEGYLKLGGENKACHYENIDKEDWQKQYDEKLNSENQSEYIKLVLKTPAIFAKGDWKPDFSKINIQVLAGATSKPYSIGGFDMVLKKPKLMRKAVPEGCVYLLKSTGFKGKSLGAIREMLTGLDTFIDYKQGFGQFEVTPVADKQLGGM